MDTFLVVVFTGLVGYKYKQHRTNSPKQEQIEPDIMEEELDHSDLGVTIDDLKELQDKVRLGKKSPESEVTDTLTSSINSLFTEPPTINVPKSPKIPQLNLDTVNGDVTGSHPLNGRSASNVIPMFIETSNRRTDSGTINDFSEQFFPQDTKNTGHSVTKKPWMRAIENAYNVPRSEKVAEFPTIKDRDDVHNTSIPDTIRAFENLHTNVTVPRSSEKQFEYPVEPIQTQNEGGGGLRGHRQMQRYHRFNLSDNPLLEMNEGPRGNFAGGAGKSGMGSSLENDKKELTINYTGIPVAPSFKVGGPEKSFELEASNAEGYILDKHTSFAGSRAPVEQSVVQASFRVADDDKLETYNVSENANLSRTSRPKGTNTDNDSTFKDPTVETQTVLGAPVSKNLVAKDKSSIVKAKAKGELLSLAAPMVDFQAGSKKVGPQALVSKSHLEKSDTKLTEEDTSSRVRGSSIRNKSVVTDNSMSTNDNKALINNKELTNFLAPQNKSLPPHLRNKPTSSVTATRDIDLKPETLDTVGLSRSKGAKVGIKTSTKLVGEPTKQKIGTLFDKKSLDLLSNPYVMV